MEATNNSDHTIKVRMEGVAKYYLDLKLSTQAPGADKMTVLMYAVSFVKE